jgi:neuropeptide Y receptor
MSAKDSAVTADGRAASREKKLRKTNTLLVAIVIIFTIW